MAKERALKEYTIQSSDESYDAIVYPLVDENFEIKPALIYLVQQNQFFGSPTEDPNLHVSNFLRLSGTLNANQEAVRLHLFPFSLGDRASAWFNSLEVGSITSWNQMRQTFLSRFFPHSKTVQLRNQIIRFTQKDGESLYHAWERFKEMLRLCPHHGLEKWFIIHAFYNGLLYSTRIYVDAAAGGALMNKTYTAAYALIEDMVQNYYQWTSERVISAVAPSPSKKGAGMYEVSSSDHLTAKVDALFHKIDKLNVSAYTPAPVMPPSEIRGIIDHTGAECQLGSAESLEQLNYAQYNQGMRPTQNFFNKTPQNPLGQEAQPDYTSNQRTFQKSNLELMLENCILTQTQQNIDFKTQTEALKDSLDKLTIKVDGIATNNTMLELQVAQVAQQIASFSKTPGIFPSQPETNPKTHINAIIPRDGNQLEAPVVTTKVIKNKKLSSKPQSENAIGERDKPIVSSPHKTKLPYPQRLPKPNLIGPCSFSIPCMIGSEPIKKDMCDLGDSVSLMPLSLFERLGIG
jgi:hypothetical protein